jgi:hypothetical protein
MNRILLFALSLTTTVITNIRIDASAIVIAVRPHRRRQRRCGDYGDI